MKKDRMNYSLSNRAALAFVAVAAMLATGCASVAVSNDAIEQDANLHEILIT